MRRKLVTIISAAIIFGGFVYMGLQSPLPFIGSRLHITGEKIQLEKQCGAQEHAMVEYVIDGDTVILTTGQHVRLIGINADETNEKCFTAAKEALQQLVGGKTVRLEKDQSDTDKYGRCLRYVFVDDNNISLEMVKRGLAVAMTYPPDVRYSTDIEAAQTNAKQTQSGCEWK